MILAFDSDVAKVCGVNAAVILNNMQYWIIQNESNKKNFFDGYYWTYNSMKAFENLFDYMTRKQIRTALDKLLENEMILKGNFNADPFDRTAWYTLTNKAWILLGRREKSNTGSDLQGTCSSDPEGTSYNIYNIYNTNTDINTDINNISNTNVLDCQTRDVRRCLDAWNSLSDVGIKQVSKLSSSSKRYSNLIARIKEYGIEDVLKAIGKIRESDFLQGRTNSRRKWSITFDWFVLPSNFPKVLEGNYDNDENNSQQYTAPTVNDGGWQ